MKNKLKYIELFCDSGRLDVDGIDIVALKLEKNQALVAEVKRRKKNFKPGLFTAKVEHLKHKVLEKYSIETCFLSLEDM